MSALLQRLRGRMSRPYRRLRELIPFLFTFSNVLFGFSSIVKTIEGNFVAAAAYIMLAAVMDGLDGRIARYLGTAGDLGSELDSLCDAISFCLAPAVLLYTWYLQGFGHGWLFVPALVIYVCAGLLRLARFNLSGNDQQLFFLGLPTTIAAVFFAQIVLYRELVSESPLARFLGEKVLVGLIASIAFLMVSSVRFPAFKGQNLSFKNVGTYIKIGIMGALAIRCIQHGYPFFLLLVTAYILGGLLMSCFAKTKKLFRGGP